MFRVHAGRRYTALLLPVFAMRGPGDLGIGDTAAVRTTVEFCSRHGFSLLQLLPIHETIGDHSPYNPISSRALSPALLSLTPEDVPGLTEEALAAAAPASWVAQLQAGPVKHAVVQPLKLQILLSAYRAFTSAASGGGAEKLRHEFSEFKARNSDWLPAYTLFRVLVREYEGDTNWFDWRPEHQSFSAAQKWADRQPSRGEAGDMRDAFAYIQWVGWRQWAAVRGFAEEHGVGLMGEMPFGVGRCSVDAWSMPDLFDTRWSVGSRPLVFFDTNKDSEQWGQNWGLPAYRWDNHRATQFQWLRGRVSWEAQFFHACRIDHLRGYFRMYLFPWSGGAQHAEFARLTEEEARVKTGGLLPRFVPGADEDDAARPINDAQGRELIRVLKQAAGDMHLVAEIMGQMPEYIRQAIEDLQLASLTFPQLEVNPDRSLRPAEAFRPLSLATYANHDNAPLASIYLRLTEEARGRTHAPASTKTDLDHLLRWVGWQGPAPDELDDELLAMLQQALLNTPCQIAAFMSSDVFGIAQRFNLPGSYGAGTWAERLEYPLEDFEVHPQFSRRLATLARLIRESGRVLPEGEPGGSRTGHVFETDRNASPTARSPGR